METALEDRVGYKIHKLVREGRINPAAELAYQEFGFRRAVKIYNNAGRITDAEAFAEKYGYLKELVGIYLYQGQNKEAKRLAKKLGLTDLTKGLKTPKKIGPPLSSRNSEPVVKRGLESDLEEEIEITQ